MKRNLTIQLDETTIQKARQVAARRSISISRLVTEEIEQAARRQSLWQISKATALKQLSHPFSMGSKGVLPSRDSLYER